MTKRTNPIEDATDEKGNPIVSGVLYETRCEWCDCPVPVRGSGRRPRFCGPAHRLAMHRAVEAYRRALEDARRAQAEADAKVERARMLVARGAGDWGTGLDSQGAKTRLEAIRFAPARHETSDREFRNDRGRDETPEERATQPAWIWDESVKSWVDPLERSE